MSSIPKGLTDKDMFQNYVEEASLEDTFIKAEKIADQKRRERAGIEPPAELGRALTFLAAQMARKLNNPVSLVILTMIIIPIKRPRVLKSMWEIAVS